MQAKNNILSPLTDLPTWIGIWASIFAELTGDSEYRLGGFYVIKNDHKIYHFWWLYTQKDVAILHGQPIHIISTLFSQFYFFQTAILFKPIFLRIQFSLVAISFHLVLVYVWVDVCIIYITKHLEIKVKEY